VRKATRWVAANSFSCWEDLLNNQLTAVLFGFAGLETHVAQYYDLLLILKNCDAGI